MATILTLCDLCRSIYDDAFNVKPISGQTTTAKKKICEHCKRKFPQSVLKQYLISGKRGKCTREKVCVMHEKELSDGKADENV